MGLIEDFATWTEKTRRQLTRESGDDGRQIADELPPGVPVSVVEALEFIDALVEAEPSDGIVDRAEKWREKLCRTLPFRHGHSSRASTST